MIQLAQYTHTKSSLHRASKTPDHQRRLRHGQI